MQITIIAGIVILLMILLLSGAKKSKQQPTDFNMSMSIKGFMATIIMVNHILSILVYDKAIVYLTNLSSIAVGIFFFYSGYGIWSSAKKRENYLQGFLYNRILLKLYMPFVITNLIYYFVLSAFEESIPFIKIFGIGLITNTNWYVIEILIYYVLFLLIYRINRGGGGSSYKKSGCFIATAVYSISICIMVIMDIKYNIGTWWYISSSGFIIGIIYANNETKYIGLIEKYKRNILFGLVGLFIILYVLQCNMDAIISETYVNYALTAVAILLVPLAILILLGAFSNIRVGNPVLLFLGKISYPLYMVHMLFKRIIIQWIRPDIFVERLLTFLLIIGTSILSAWLINQLISTIIKRLSIKIN